MAAVRIYLTPYCGYCRAALRLLEKKGITDVEAVRVDLDPARRAEMQARAGRYTVPQIWIGERHVGGFEELQALELAGELDGLLAVQAS
ncbi:MAG TPA: glutaredoxin 3 [Burkholderiales bacterium]|nr:glutaredoxin 3 [Burkholderiales bacterium]